MNAPEQIKRCEAFLNMGYTNKLFSDKTKQKKHIVIDFIELMKYDPEIATLVLEEPTDSLKIFSIAAHNINEELIDILIRVKNANRFCKKSINALRTKDTKKFITVDGIIKQKSDIKGQITAATFECPDCAVTHIVLQPNEKKHKVPSRCTCGRKNGFRLIDKKQIDAFSLMLEEPLAEIQGNTKLVQIRVMCREGLTTDKVERQLFQGKRIEVTGELKEYQIEDSKGNLTNRVEWYIEANYITFPSDDYADIKLTDEDIKKIKEEGKSPSIIKDLSDSIFQELYKYDDEKKGLTLLMVGGVEKESFRGVINILLIGDPGSAKSSFLKIVQKNSPRAQYIAGVGVSSAGLTAAVVHDELLGGFCLEAGALPLNSGGILCCDELDKIGDEHKKALHEPLEQQTVSVSKAGIQATLIAKTAILAAANPKFGSYSDYETIYSQLNLEDTLIDRFDLVYPIKSKNFTKEDRKKIAMKILGRGETDLTESEQSKPKYDKEFIRKYIAYTRSLTPSMTYEVRAWFAERYGEVCEAKEKAQEKTIKITGRNVNTMKRMAQAIAKIRQHETISLDDAKEAYEMVSYYLNQVGINPSSGEAVIEDSLTGKRIPEKDLLARMHKLFRELGEREPVHIDQILAVLKTEGFGDDYKIFEIIDKMKSAGQLIEPRANQYKLQ